MNRLMLSKLDSCTFREASFKPRPQAAHKFAINFLSTTNGFAIESMKQGGASLPLHFLARTSKPARAAQQMLVTMAWRRLASRRSFPFEAGSRAAPIMMSRIWSWFASDTTASRWPRRTSCASSSAAPSDFGCGKGWYP